VRIAKDLIAISNQASAMEPDYTGQSERIEYLERLIAQLLAENQVTRFELYAYRQRFHQFKELLTNIDTHSQDRLPLSEVIIVLDSLCAGCEVPGRDLIGTLKIDRSGSRETLESIQSPPTSSKMLHLEMYQ
jgi:hypothetical protein